MMTLEELKKIFNKIKSQENFYEGGFFLTNESAYSSDKNVDEEGLKKKVIKALRNKELDLDSIKFLMIQVYNAEEVRFIFSNYPMTLIEYCERKMDDGLNGYFSSYSLLNYFLDSNPINPIPTLEQIKKFYERCNPEKLDCFYSLLQYMKALIDINIDKRNFKYVVDLKKLYKENFKELLSLHLKERPAGRFSFYNSIRNSIDKIPFLDIKELKSLIDSEDNNIPYEDKLNLYSLILKSHYYSSNSSFASRFINRENVKQEFSFSKELIEVEEYQLLNLIDVVQAIRDLLKDYPSLRDLEETGAEMRYVFKALSELFIKADINDWKNIKEKIREIIYTEDLFIYLRQNKSFIQNSPLNYLKKIIRFIFSIIDESDQLDFYGKLTAVLNRGLVDIALYDMIEELNDYDINFVPSTAFAQYYNYNILREKDRGNLNKRLMSIEMMNDEYYITTHGGAYRKWNRDIPIFYDANRENDYGMFLSNTTALSVNYKNFRKFLNPSSFSEHFYKTAKVDWHLISSCQLLSNEFILKYHNRINISMLSYEYINYTLNQEVLEFIFSEESKKSDFFSNTYRLKELCQAAVNKCSLSFIKDHLEFFITREYETDKKGKRVPVISIKEKPNLTIEDLI